MTMQGIRLHVLRDALGDCTNGGISAAHTTLWLIDLPDQCAAFTREVPDGAPTVYLTQTARDYPVLAAGPPSGGRIVGPMAGGNYAIAQYGDDAKAWKALGLSGAIPVHDRYETQAQYDALSR
jgi:hypothetical protein